MNLSRNARMSALYHRRCRSFFFFSFFPLSLQHDECIQRCVRFLTYTVVEYGKWKKNVPDFMLFVFSFALFFSDLVDILLCLSFYLQSYLLEIFVAAASLTLSFCLYFHFVSVLTGKFSYKKYGRYNIK